MSDPVKEATHYIEDSVVSFKDVGEIAWRFLLGNRILESLDDMVGKPEKGTDIQVKYQNNDNCTLRLGDYEIYVAHKPSSGGKSPVNQPNSE